MQQSLKLWDTNYHFKCVKVPGTVLYGNACYTGINNWIHKYIFFRGQFTLKREIYFTADCSVYVNNIGQLNRPALKWHVQILYRNSSLQISIRNNQMKVLV